jgi:hypothetical protein
MAAAAASPSKLAGDEEAGAPILRNLTGTWQLDAGASADRSKLLEAMKVGWFARMIVGNPSLSLEVAHSSTRVSIATHSGHGELTEEYILDGVVRTETQSGETVMVQASVDDTESIVVEKLWERRKMSTIDRRELATRTRFKQVSAGSGNNPVAVDEPPTRAPAWQSGQIDTLMLMFV